MNKYFKRGFLLEGSSTKLLEIAMWSYWLHGPSPQPQVNKHSIIASIIYKTSLMYVLESKHINNEWHGNS